VTRLRVVSNLAVNVAFLSLVVGLAFRSVVHALFAPVFLPLITTMAVPQGGLQDPNVLLAVTVILLTLASFGVAIRWPRRRALLILAHVSTLPYFCVSALFLAWSTNTP
jgi:hypothetical protein